MCLFSSICSGVSSTNIELLRIAADMTISAHTFANSRMQSSQHFLFILKLYIFVKKILRCHSNNFIYMYYLTQSERPMTKLKYESGLVRSYVNGCCGNAMFTIQVFIQLIVTFVSLVASISCNICSEDQHIF